MRTQDIERQRQRLDELFKKVGNVGDDLEMQSHWAKYLCVLVAGFLETSLRKIYSDYARRCASSKVAYFVDTKLRPTRNLKMHGVIQLARSFSAEWGDSLVADTQGEHKDAVDSIVANRHLIAHGRSVEITFIRVKKYYEKALEVLELIENQCHGEGHP
jgi:hypothetical protein